MARKKKDKFTLVWDTESCTDGIEVGNSLEYAKNEALDTLILWMTTFGDDKEHHSKDDWDRMIYECGVRVYLTKDVKKEDAEPIWCPSTEEEKEIGWMLTEDMDVKTYNTYAKMYGWKQKRSIKKKN